jgi:hypothetical protein
MNLKRSNLTVQSLLYQARQAQSQEVLLSLLAEAMLTYEIHHEHLLCRRGPFKSSLKLAR